MYFHKKISEKPEPFFENVGERRPAEVTGTLPRAHSLVKVKGPNQPCGSNPVEPLIPHQFTPRSDLYRATHLAAEHAIQSHLLPVRTNIDYRNSKADIPLQMTISSYLIVADLVSCNAAATAEQGRCTLRSK
jgi:hypothetical protein